MGLFSKMTDFSRKILNRTADNHTDEWLKRFRIKTFIDIGAYMGEYIEYASSRFPDTDIYAFEPVKESFSHLRKKFSGYKKVNIYNVAIGEENKSGKIFKSSYAPSSSLLRMGKPHKKAFPFSAGETAEKINMYMLDHLMKGKKLKREIFIKVDTQGYEDKVIDGGKKTFSQAKIIQIEVSFEELYKKQVLFDGIYRRLIDLDFVYHGNKSQIISPTDGTILQAHAYFIRA